MSREGQSLWDVIFPSYRDKNEEDKSLNRMSDNIFRLTLEILKF